MRRTSRLLRLMRTGRHRAGDEPVPVSVGVRTRRRSDRRLGQLLLRLRVAHGTRWPPSSAGPRPQIDGALSVVLAVTGLCSYARGRWIDRYGGRRMMTAAAFAGAALLFGWAHVSELWQLYAISVGIGVVSAMTLYEAAFAVVARMFGADYRRAIIVITLFGGLASTVFVPLTQHLVDAYGWRTALIALAMIQLPFVAGIPFLLLRNRETPRATSPTRTTHAAGASIRPALAHPVFWLLALSFVSFAFMFTSLVFNIVPMLRETGYTTAEAVAAYACIGPAQLAGRVAILTLERFISLTAAGLIGTLFPVVAVHDAHHTPAHSPLVFVFAVAFGTGMGIKTIVQATAAPEFLGRAAYGALQGALDVPRLPRPSRVTAARRMDLATPRQLRPARDRAPPHRRRLRRRVRPRRPATTKVDGPLARHRVTPRRRQLGKRSPIGRTPQHSVHSTRARRVPLLPHPLLPAARHIVPTDRRTGVRVGLGSAGYPSYNRLRRVRFPPARTMSARTMSARTSPCRNRAARSDVRNARMDF